MNQNDTGNTDEFANAQFKNYWRNLSARIAKNSADHGFHGTRDLDRSITLMHTELSEAIEADRAYNPPSEKIPQFSQVEEELADCAIRIMDCGVEHNLDIAGAIIAKHEHNKGRPMMHGGKKY